MISQLNTKKAIPDTEILTGWNMIAEYLNICPSSAMNWKKKFNLPVTHIGASILTTKSALNLWITKNMSNTKVKHG